jgi:uncharacterized protein YbaP (TraB family)
VRRASLLAVFTLGLCVFSARAADAPIVAHPAMWHVKGAAGEIYLFGSIHLLPPNVDWQEGAIKDAIARTDVLVFEIPLDSSALSRMRDAIAKQGYLPKGRSLRAMLTPDARDDLDKDATIAGISSQSLDTMRPWLAELVIVTSDMALQNASPKSGPDSILENQAHKTGKELRYLETIDQQMTLLIPSDPKIELSGFEADLKEFQIEKNDFAAMINSWSTADVAKLNDLLNGEFKDEPDARKVFLEDRNRAWVPKLEAMLKEPKVFFVTVGAGHLIGKNSVPELLRADGYKVDGP